MHYLARIRANTTAMGTLIDELLDFSQLQRRPLQTAPTPLRSAVDAAIVMLQPDDGVELVIGDLPTWEVDQTLFVQVFANLIGNALKFSRTQDEPRIEIGTDPSGQVFVRDNGVGFDPQYAAKMFGVFQRLHRAEDFDGSGVGLAIVERIMTRHGGRITADGAPEMGATFMLDVDGARDETPR
jgi:light-regulated signal transduction histidine kinase (bacteriophytochrome)